MGVSQRLSQKVEDRTRVINSPPSPEFLAPDLDADLIQETSGTGSGFPMPKVLREERSKFDVPLAQRFIADLDTALLEEFLNVTLAQREMMVEPERLLDDA